MIWSYIKTPNIYNFKSVKRLAGERKNIKVLCGWQLLSHFYEATYCIECGLAI